MAPAPQIAVAPPFPHTNIIFNIALPPTATATAVHIAARPTNNGSPFDYFNDASSTAPYTGSISPYSTWVFPNGSPGPTPRVLATMTTSTTGSEKAADSKSTAPLCFNTLNPYPQVPVRGCVVPSSTSIPSNNNGTEAAGAVQVNRHLVSAIVGLSLVLAVILATLGVCCYLKAKKRATTGAVGWAFSKAKNSKAKSKVGGQGSHLGGGSLRQPDRAYGRKKGYEDIQL